MKKTDYCFVRERARTFITTNAPTCERSNKFTHPLTGTRYGWLLNGCAVLVEMCAQTVEVAVSVCAMFMCAPKGPVKTFTFRRSRRRRRYSRRRRRFDPDLENYTLNWRT